MTFVKGEVVDVQMDRGKQVVGRRALKREIATRKASDTRSRPRAQLASSMKIAMHSSSPQCTPPKHTATHPLGLDSLRLCRGQHPEVGGGGDVLLAGVALGVRGVVHGVAQVADALDLVLDLAPAQRAWKL